MWWNASCDCLLSLHSCVQKTNRIFLVPWSKGLITCHSSCLWTMELICQWKVGVFVRSTFFLECSLGKWLIECLLPSWEEGVKLISAGSHCGELSADVSREGQLAIWFCCSQVRGWGTFRTSFWPPISCCQINWKKASKSDQPITPTYILISQGVPRAKCYCPWQNAALPLKYKHAPHSAPVELKSQDMVLSVCWLVLSLGHT